MVAEPHDSRISTVEHSSSGLTAPLALVWDYSPRIQGFTRSLSLTSKPERLISTKSTPYSVNQNRFIDTYLSIPLWYQRLPPVDPFAAQGPSPSPSLTLSLSLGSRLLLFVHTVRFGHLSFRAQVLVGCPRCCSLRAQILRGSITQLS